MKRALFRVLLVGAFALSACAAQSSAPSEATPLPTTPIVQIFVPTHTPTHTAAPTSIEVVPTVVDVWVTTGDGTEKLNHRAGTSFSPGTGSNPVQIQVDEDTRYQQMDGFGAAVTDSAAWVISHTLSIEQRDLLMNKLFSPEDGIGINYVRLPMGASDFVTSTHYTYDDMPPGQSDPDLAFFSIAHDRAYILPILRQAKGINPQLRFMSSPWSASAWMKSSETLYGGSLKTDYYPAYADYFVRFVQQYQDDGISIDAVTVQNEPHHADDSYPTMWMEWFDQADFIKDYLAPAFDEGGIANTKILVWDHNWDEPDYPLDILNDAEAKAYVAGSAWHCYAGTPDAQTLVHEAHPDKDIYFTECTGGEWDTDFASVFVWNFRNLFIGAIRHWAKTVLLWNLALDENHGPHIGGCDNCRGVATIYQDGMVEYNVEYYIIGHLSKFVVPGAYRIASTMHDRQIETVAFQNPDGSKVLVVLNSSSDPVGFDVQWRGQYFSYDLPMQSVVTFTWVETKRAYLPIVVLQRE
jgi:glucosylceramidase